MHLARHRLGGAADAGACRWRPRRHDPHQGQKTEIGNDRERRSGVQERVIRMKALEDETAEARLAAEEQRKAGMRQMADGFEAAVGGIIGIGVVLCHRAAGHRSDDDCHGDRDRQPVDDRGGSAEEAASNVSTVAAAAEELGSSVQEIGRQVAGSAELAQRAVHEADQTGTLVQELSSAVSRIGDVVGLISSIRRPDQSPRPQRHDRGSPRGRRRAGFRGRGLRV